MRRAALVLIGVLAVSPARAAAESAVDADEQFIKSIDRMMVALGRQSSRSSAAIRQAYRRHMDLLVLDEYAALEAALATGGLVPLPADPLAFNLKPRVDGKFPIGEKDLDNQSSYIAARAETIGALIEVASRVKSGPLEITSLVRHSEYQGALRATNANAATTIPMHTMGLAFDIALINTPLPTIHEIRDVLLDMQAAGDILVIGERRQLVFHVVPHPRRLGHFAQVYARAVEATMPDANIIGAAPIAGTPNAGLMPAVHAEVIAVRPTEEFLEEWWRADDARADLAIEVSPAIASGAAPAGRRSFFARVAQGCAALVTGLAGAARAIFS
jgi:hypothetical protein